MTLGVDQVLCLRLPGVDGQVLLAEVHLQWCFCSDSSATALVQVKQPTPIFHALD